jgi:hypothetical protein
MPPKRRTLSELHGVTIQKNVIFIVTAVRTSNPASGFIFQNYRCCMLRFSLSVDRNFGHPLPVTNLYS